MSLRNAVCPSVLNTEWGARVGGGLRPFLTGCHKSPRCRRCLPNNFHTSTCPGARAPASRTRRPPHAPRERERQPPPPPAVNSGLIGMQRKWLLYPIAIQSIITVTCVFLIALTSNLTMTKSFSAILNFIILICQA